MLDPCCSMQWVDAFSSSVVRRLVSMALAEGARSGPRGLRPQSPEAEKRILNPPPEPFSESMQWSGEEMKGQRGQHESV
jgi:hypothetical protein